MYASATAAYRFTEKISVTFTGIRRRRLLHGRKPSFVPGILDHHVRPPDGVEQLPRPGDRRLRVARQVRVDLRKRTRRPLRRVVHRAQNVRGVPDVSPSRSACTPQERRLLLRERGDLHVVVVPSRPPSRRSSGCEVTPLIASSAIRRASAPDVSCRGGCSRATALTRLSPANQRIRLHVRILPGSRARTDFARSRPPPRDPSFAEDPLGRARSAEPGRSDRRAAVSHRTAPSRT